MPIGYSDANGNWRTAPDVPAQSGSILFPTSPFGCHRVIQELVYADFDTRSFRQIFQVPFTGPMWVRAVYHTDSGVGTMVTNTAFAAGRSISEDNPLDAAGAPAAWTAVSGTVVSAASGTVNDDGNYGVGKSGWVFVNVPAPIDGGQGGYIVVGTHSTALSRRMQVSASSANYEAFVNALLPNMKYRAYANAAGDNVSTNQAGFVNAAVGGNAFLNNYHACAGIEIQAAPGALTFTAGAGDSLEAGYGTNTTVNPMGYGQGVIAASQLTAAGRPTVYMNLGCSGKGAAFFNRRVRDALLDTSFKPSYLFLQGWSLNDTITDATCLAGISQALETSRLAQAAGVRRVMLEIPTGVNSDGAGTVATRLRVNALLRNQAAAAGIPIVDRERLLTDPVTNLIRPQFVAPDGLHYSRAGVEVLGAERTRMVQLYR